MEKLGNDRTVKGIMDEGTLSDLSLFAQSNIAATGYLLGRLFMDSGDMSLKMPCTDGAIGAWVTVSFVVRNEADVETIVEDDVYRTRMAYSSGDSASTKTVNVSTLRKRYGKKFNLTVVWRFESADTTEPYTVRFSEDMEVEATRYDRMEKISVPEPQQFFIGSVLDILHRADSVNNATLPGLWNSMSAEQKQFPRRNPEIERIVVGLNEFCKMADFISYFVGRYVETSDITKRLNVPWAIHRKSAPDDAVSAMRRERWPTSRRCRR